MEAQVESRSGEFSVRPDRALGVVAASQGAGNRRLFESMGAVVVEGGQGENPSTRDLAGAVRRTGAGSVILLPNNENVIPAAEQVGELAEIPVHVVPTRNLAGGLSAMVDFEPEGEPEEVAREMRQTAENLRYAEVVRSVRQTTVGDRDIPEGSYMGFVGGELAAVEESIEEAAVKLAGRLVEEGAEILTLLRGEDLGEQDASRVAEELRALDETVEVELQDGGQPVYPLQMAAE